MIDDSVKEPNENELNNLLKAFGESEDYVTIDAVSYTHLDVYKRQVFEVHILN